MNASNNLVLEGIAEPRRLNLNHHRAFRNDGCRGTAHPNAKLNTNCSSELQMMNHAKDHLLVRDRVGYSFRRLVERTIREQCRKERQVAERRGTKHQFQARNSCILDGRNYRIARRLFPFAKAQF